MDKYLVYRWCGGAPLPRLKTSLFEIKWLWFQHGYCCKNWKKANKISGSSELTSCTASGLQNSHIGLQGLSGINYLPVCLLYFSYCLSISPSLQKFHSSFSFSISLSLFPSPSLSLSLSLSFPLVPSLSQKASSGLTEWRPWFANAITRDMKPVGNQRARAECMSHHVGVAAARLTPLVCQSCCIQHPTA